MPSKIPATVITGFLGAGKTSMIRHLLRNASGRRIALVINEFGDLGIDGEILKGCGIEDCDDDNVVELSNGCICCTVADDFLPTIEALLARDPAPDHIVIETSGLALPKPLVKAFSWPAIRTRVTVDGVVTLVDGPAVAAGTFAHDPQHVQGIREADEALDHDTPLEELFEEQLTCADMVVINKTDLMDAQTLAEVSRTVQGKIRSGVRVISARDGAVDVAVLLGLDAAAEDDLDARPSHIDDGEEHDHDDFDSFVLDLGQIDEPLSLVARLERALREHDVLRIKGFVDVTTKPMRMLVQGVGGRVQHYFDRDWNAADQRSTRIVVIGQSGFDRVAITECIQG
ncbi:MAG: cobalamin biosynthesis protein CobW [Gammaproteobacteria bacterium]|jgi:cobalamin biosynthesis protein CobW